MKKVIILFMICSIISYSEDEKQKAEIVKQKIEKKRENDSGQKRNIEIEYNEKGQILQEIHRNSVGDIISKYVFKEYDLKNGKPIKGVILDGEDKEKAVVELHYNKKSEIVLMIQKDENGDIISVSQFFKDREGVFEEVTNDKAELYKLLKHYENKSVNLLSESGKVEVEKMKNDKKIENAIENKTLKEEKRESIVAIETLKTKEELDEIDDAVTITRLELSNDKTKQEDTLLAELITDGIKSRTRAEVVMINGGAIKSSIKAGKIYREDIRKVIPESKVYIIYLTGEEIIEILKNEKTFENGSECYLNSAGITFERNGLNVRNIKINGFPIDMYAKYKTAVNSYIADKNGVYSLISQEEKEESKESAVDMIEKYMTIIKIIDKSYVLEVRNGVTK